MALPSGVQMNPRQVNLVAKDRPAVIQISTGDRYPANTNYEIKPRIFSESIEPYLHGDWEDFDRLFTLRRERIIVLGEDKIETSPVIYSGAEYRGDEKLPNITVVANLSTMETYGRSPYSLWVLGCTMGHWHPTCPTGHRIQEVYEFKSYGMMVLDQESGEVELCVAKSGDKVAVTDGCHMTLYNLDDDSNPLITLDFADPVKNASDKRLVKKCGPVLLAFYDDAEVVFRLNRLYLNNPYNPAGVKLTNSLKSKQERQVTMARGTRLSLGGEIYENLTQNADIIGQFAQLGISIRKASPEVALEPLPAGEGSRLYFMQPLVESTQPGTDVYRYFFPQSDRAKPGSPDEVGLSGRALRIAKDKEDLIRVNPVDRPLDIVVEGGGAWVNAAYRPQLKSRKGSDSNPNLFVHYADDTRWQGRPPWANSEKEEYDLEKSWEEYLDKANPDDFARYQKLRPDVVFVVTPDFTHSEIACNWLNKSPLIFVEKPFDAHIGNVDRLLRESGRLDHRRTMVFGLDHYQFYALPIIRMSSIIDEHLGGALARVVFYMTESWALESKRMKTLQHGLTLDLLPHLPALLTYFGDVKTIDQIQVIEAGQHRPLVEVQREGAEEKQVSFRNETYSRVRFTFRDYSGNDYNVPCEAVVGKGLSREVKYMEVLGRSGNAIRVDLMDKKKIDPNISSDYPWDSLFFIQSEETLPIRGAMLRTVSDPYQNRQLHILEDMADKELYCPRLDRERYGKLLDDLMNGTSNAFAATLMLSEAEAIVQALDRIWRATQATKPFMEYKLRALNALQAEIES